MKPAPCRKAIPRATSSASHCRCIHDNVSSLPGPVSRCSRSPPSIYYTQVTPGHSHPYTTHTSLHVNPIHILHTRHSTSTPSIYYTHVTPRQPHPYTTHTSLQVAPIHILHTRHSRSLPSIYYTHVTPGRSHPYTTHTSLPSINYTHVSQSLTCNKIFGQCFTKN
jgi:hypothetical protein